jgi:hypothetical protein
MEKQKMASYWQQQQDATLRGEVNYAYTAGLPYNTLPVGMYTSGFNDGFDDRGNEAAVLPPARNLPTYREDLYNYDPSNPARDGPSSDMGLHVMSPHETARHLAPYIPNLPWMDIGRLTPILYGRKLTHGSEMPIGRQRVQETGVHQKNSGLAPGMLTDPPAPEMPPQGAHTWVPSVLRWW